MAMKLLVAFSQRLDDATAHKHASATNWVLQSIHLHQSPFVSPELILLANISHHCNKALVAAQLWWIKNVSP